MKGSVLLFSAIVLTLIGTSCFAGISQKPSDSNTPRQLQDYLRYSALNNASLKATFERWKAAIEKIPQAQALPDPKFTYSYFIREVETRVGPQRHKFGIMQVFPWFGKIEARTDAASAEAKAARKRYEAEKLKLFWQVKEAFYEYLYLASAVKIAKHNLELLKHFEEVTRTRYMAAAGTHPDVIRAQVELAKLEDVLKSLEELRKPIVAKLNSILNRQSSELLPWPVKEELRRVVVGRQEIITLLKQINPELAAIDFEVTAAKSKLELAKKQFYPDVGVGLDWIETGGAVSQGVSDSGRDPVILMFSMNLPIWSESYKAAEQQAKSVLRKTEQQRTEAENTIVARAEQVLYELEDSSRKIKLYSDVLVLKAEELLEASETAYRAGTIDFLSLIDAQRTVLNFQLQYERAITDNQQKLAELEMLVGRELTTDARESAEE
ncbi:MAG: TolC family protein [Planctomycetota bacterium]|nr:MAG: TolC family protein [Planctomycetota bacterium]